MLALFLIDAAGRAGAAEPAAGEQRAALRLGSGAGAGRVQVWAVLFVPQALAEGTGAGDGLPGPSADGAANQPRPAAEHRHRRASPRCWSPASTVADGRRLASFVNLLLLAMIGHERHGAADGPVLAVRVPGNHLRLLLRPDRLGARQARPGRGVQVPHALGRGHGADAAARGAAGDGCGRHLVRRGAPAASWPADGNVLAKVAVGAFLCGLFIKGGLVPFHGWLPEAYSAAPAAGVRAAGGHRHQGLRRLRADPGWSTYVFGREPAAERGAAGGRRRLDRRRRAGRPRADATCKRMLAYSSISQVGYIVLGLGCGTPLGFAGAVLPPVQPRDLQVAAVRQRGGRGAADWAPRTWTAWAAWARGCRSPASPR